MPLRHSHWRDPLNFGRLVDRLGAGWIVHRGVVDCC